MKKRLVSIFLALAMCMGLAVPAFAAETEPLSEYGGQTIPVQVVEETEDGLTSRVIEVAIPDGATKAEEDVLVRSAALGKDGATTFSANEVYYPIGTATGPITLDSTPQKVGGGYPQVVTFDDLSKIMIDITVESLSLSQTTIYFQIQNAGKPASDSGVWNSIKPYGTQPPWRVIFMRYEYPTDPSKTGITVYGKTYPGTTAVLSYCGVFGVVG